MRCLSPLSIKRPEGRSNADRITVPCGKCLACLSKKRADWAFRLHQEWKNADSALFVTLTYNEENIPLLDKCNGDIFHYDSDGCIPGDHSCFLDFSLSKEDIQVFIREVRRRFEGIKIRYFITGEYGPETGRPHYHGLLFNVPFEEYKLKKRKEDFFEWSRILLDGIWKKGFVTATQVTEERIGYTAKYCITKQDELNNQEYQKEMGDIYTRVPQFSLMSRRPGIGSNYLTLEQIKWHKADGEYRDFIMDQGYMRGLPRYYKEKIFNDDEKEVINSKNKVVLSKLEVSSGFGIESDGTYSALLELEQKKQYINRVVNKLNKNNKL